MSLVQPIIEGRGLIKYFQGRGGVRTVAVDNVDIAVAVGERVGLVGESGSGKSTLGRLLLRLQDVDDGSVWFAGSDITKTTARALLPVRRQLQIVFQDPASSLNPRLSVEQLVAEGLIIHRLHRESRRERVLQLLDEVGLDAALIARRPHELSGGQKQRVGIARALAVEPRFLLLDEPVSALDVSVQAQIVNLLQSLSTTKHLAMLFIAHDLHVVRHLCERVMVMHQGKIVEAGPTAQVFDSPQHPYTQALLAAVPVPDPSRRRAPPPTA